MIPLSVRWRPLRLCAGTLRWVAGQTDHRNQCVRFQSLIAGWFIVVLTVWILAAVVDQYIPPARGAGISRTAVEVLSTWDGRWYADIALNGYTVEGQAIRRFAFFPMLPAIARLLGGQSHTILAGILFGQLCLLGSLFLINRLAEVNSETPLRQQPGFWLLISPLSFFFSVFYTESIFLFLTLLSIIVCRTGRFWFASLFGVMTGLTRPTAICLPVIFLWWAMRSLHERRRCLGLLLCAAAPFAGIALYVGTVSYILGDPGGYVQIQRQGWESQWSLPFAHMFRDLTNSFYALIQAQIPSLGEIVRPLSSLSIMFLLFWGWRNCDPAFLVYVIVSMMFIHSLEPTRSTLRYELVLFPMFLLVAQVMSPHPRLTWVVSAVMLVMQVVLFTRHVSWRWVA